MRSFGAFFKKELMESVRGSRIIIFSILFVVLGVLNTGLAKLIPLLMELLSEELAASGMVIEIEANGLAAWAQYFENISIGLITFVFVFSNTFTGEYKSGTLILILTKGLARFKVLFAKALVMFIFWTVGYWLCFGVTHVCNLLLLGDSEATGLMTAAVLWWLFGVFIISLVVFFSAVFSSYIGVLMGTGGVFIVSYILLLLPKISEYTPAALMNYANLLSGTMTLSDYTAPIIIVAVLTVSAMVFSVPLFNKKQL